MLYVYVSDCFNNTKWTLASTGQSGIKECNFTQTSIADGWFKPKKLYVVIP